MVVWPNVDVTAETLVLEVPLVEEVGLVSMCATTCLRSPFRVQ